MTSPGIPRVLFINDHLGYAGGAWHGVTRYCIDVLPRIDAARFRVTACFLRDPHPAARELESRGLPPVFLDRGRYDPRVLGDILRIVREERIDLLHVGGHKAILLGRLAGRLAGRPVLIHLHDVNPVGSLLALAQRSVARWTRAAIAVSEPAAAFARERFGLPADRIRILPNAVDLRVLAPPPAGQLQRIREELGLVDADRFVAIVGRLAPEKGHRHLIRAWPSLLERSPGARLLIVGDGPAREACESLVERLGLDRSIRFTGHRGDVPSILHVVDAVALPSEREGFGYAVLEAMAAGRPVVAFRVGGVPSIVIDGESGLLVPPGDGEALAQGLARVLTEPGLAERLGEGGRRRAEGFGLEGHVRELEEIYARALEPPGAA